ncbi:hypothetical protein LMG22037_05668 [Paraburkholderia phenoliruptrix]|jgi:hypothetical protein|uniref:Transglycosylase SLT domain-containing protein n=1 Tax=Paraburkholderia phenoliruptrix TaxID=252970 RepID=A0A6J5CDI7_9BURK|nr:lytic transglycosylase domain-containing protein [Paraburkholderia phenoliruptrix]CAB3732042.1 hypothetical protein LMG22037_05668 [Paraburkholderia phenoliruptrix]
MMSDYFFQMSRLIISFIFFTVSTAVLAAPGSDISACFEASGAKYHIDPRLLWAMAETESSGRASAQNLNHVSRTGTVDLGLMQINSSWLPTLARYGITREQLMADPCLNIDVGAWVLAGIIKQQGARWDAIGAYNTACTQLKGEACTASRAAYVRKVWSWYQDSRPATLPAVGPDASSRARRSPLTAASQPQRAPVLGASANGSDIVFTAEDGAE